MARGKAGAGKPGWTRFARWNNWHFLNLDRTDREPNAADCGGDCVLTGIEYHRALLADERLPNRERAEALLFLGHWVGDVHQPLHVGYGDDRGGGKIDRIESDLYASKHLHQVWDSGIIKAILGDEHFWSYAEQLKRRITPEQRRLWTAAPPGKWVAESYEIATREATHYCEWREGACRATGNSRALGENYQTLFGPVVEQRLQQAGVRLANLIDHSLTNPRKSAGLE